MTDFLLFTLYAPLASWGDLAPGELRGSWDRPSRSAVLGLLGAALGVERSDQSGHDALEAGYGIAVRLDLPGTPGVDYQTAQTLPASYAWRLSRQTRAGQLSNHNRLETILSQRTFRQDAFATIAVWGQDGARWSLAELKAALERPRFVLYAGRKSHVLCLPTAPALADAATLAAALRARHVVPGGLSTELDRLARSGRQQPVEVSHDRCRGFDSGLVPIRTERRRDAGAHRGRWQFNERLVEVGIIPEEVKS